MVGVPAHGQGHAFGTSVRHRGHAVLLKPLDLVATDVGLDADLDGLQAATVADLADEGPCDGQPDPIQGR